MTEGLRPRGSQEPLDTAYDVALLDLDGVVYLGGTAIPGAAEALRKADAAGMRLAYVTNNAFRTPAAIAALLTSFGAPGSPQDVVTSAQAAARLLAERLPAGAPVLVIGGSGLRMALRERGLRPVSTAADKPQAVVQGYSPDVNYSMLAEGGLAVAAGALFVASNGDLTLPSRRGRQPGNGSLIKVLATATGVQPLVAGKPEPPLHRESVLRTGARHPLVVGDRLDTDIEGAHRAGTDSMLVLTGVTGPAEAVAALPSQRPTYLAEDLTGLLEPHPEISAEDGAFGCQGWTARMRGDQLELDGDGERIDGLRALCAAAWAAADDKGAAGEKGAASGFRPRCSGWNDNRYLNVTTSDHSACKLSRMSGRAVRRHGDHPGVAAMLARVLCPSCCC
jgi:HAD superfamily hydrolase (TIGR01450 family)